MFKNEFGHFAQDGRAFVVTDPATPMPWCNVVCNGRYGFIVSQRGGGFSWLDNSQLNVLTRWEMDLARDTWGKHLYLSDLDSSDVWSLAPAPCNAAYDRYECTHTLGSTTFRTTRAGITASWTMTVAPEHPVELWLVTLTNESDRPRTLRVASAFEWCCGVAPDTKREFHRLFFTVTHDRTRRAIVATKNMWDVPSKLEKLHWNRPWPYITAHAVGGGGTAFTRYLAYGDKRSFLGRYGDPARPAALTQRSPAVDDRANFGRVGDPIAALGGDLTLAPGQSVELVYSLAISQSEAELQTLIDRYTNVPAAKAALAGSHAFWDRLLKPAEVHTGAPDFDLLNNHWLPYQAIAGRLWARTGFYQQSGAFGFRDQLQDSQVWLPRDPAGTRSQILLHAAHQFADGSVYHWWHPLAEFGNRTLCSDDYLWLPFLTINYLKDTGDQSILHQSAPFVDDDKPTSILDHCKRAIARALARFSDRGLPLIGSCDWNDGLSALGIEGRGESVWLAQFLAVVLDDFATVLDGQGDAATAALYRAKRAAMIDAVERLAWDGQWYRAATGDDGRWLGAASNPVGKIFLNTQTWAILAGVAPADRRDAAWNSVKAHLLADMGPLLSSPAYSEPDEDIGYITRYAPGLRENGGVYMHAATWALAAACKLKDVAAAEKIWNSISPPRRGQDADAYQAEPYVTPGNVDGPDSITPGRAGWTWYTGSAAWLNRVSLEWVVGIRPTWEGLLIDPCPWPALGKVQATRIWRGRPVTLRFDAHEFTPGVTPTLTVNGKPHHGHPLHGSHAPNLIAPSDDPGGAGGPLVIDVHWTAAVHAAPPTHVHVNGTAKAGALAATSARRSPN